MAQIDRRTVLRGAGVTMCLPWLDSLSVCAATPSSTAFPKRFAALFMGNGVNENHWGAEGSGDDMKLSLSMSPLEPLKKKINVINGLFNKNSTGQGIHPAQTGSLLTGAPLAKGPVIHSGISVDQMIASRIGHETLQPSIVLACEQPMTGYHETNFSLAYSSHISWQSAESPVPNEVYPALAFDTLFENRGSLRNLSILDRVRDAALTNVPALSMERPANGLPEDFRDHARLMCDIIALAFQTDKTRVASLLLARDLSALYYPFLDVKDGHHAASHANLSDGYERISRFHLSQLAYLAAKLDAMPEGDGTVLDNSCLMFLSNLWAGRVHNSLRLPVVLAGGLGGTLETGRSLDYLDAGDENRKMCSLYLGIMDRMGIQLDRFGDADTRLANL